MKQIKCTPKRQKSGKNCNSQESTIPSHVDSLSQLAQTQVTKTLISYMFIYMAIRTSAVYYKTLYENLLYALIFLSRIPHGEIEKDTVQVSETILFCKFYF